MPKKKHLCSFFLTCNKTMHKTSTNRTICIVRSLGLNVSFFITGVLTHIVLHLIVYAQHVCHSTTKYRCIVK